VQGAGCKVKKAKAEAKVKKGKAKKGLSLVFGIQGARCRVQGEEG